MLIGVMIGGALGALCRYLSNILIQHALVGTSYAGFPLATLLVNVGGSFLLALLVYGAPGLSPTWRAAIGTGFIGSLTTFSTFELESHGLWEQGLISWTTLYVAGNLLFGFAAVLAGKGLAQRF